MSGFEADGSAPDWLSERFDKYTALPHGPLEHLPIPLEGHIVRASSSANEAFPKQFSVGLRCGEDIDQALHFFHEYLPLAGYTIVAAGTIRTRRSWLTRPSRGPEMLVVHRDGFVGSFVLRCIDSSGTSVEATMGDPAHEPFSKLATPQSLRQLPDVQWRNYE
jgi:hypothetical protein